MSKSIDLIDPIQFKEGIALAKKAHACPYELSRVEQYETLEQLLQNDRAPYWCYWYARNVLKVRWPEVEEVILRDRYASGNYAEFVIKGRWLEAEPLILTNPAASYTYAVSVLRRRWPEAEAMIATHYDWWLDYREHFGF